MVLPLTEMVVLSSKLGIGRKRYQQGVANYDIAMILNIALFRLVVDGKRTCAGCFNVFNDWMTVATARLHSKQDYEEK